MHLLNVNTGRLKKDVEEKKGKVREKYGILSHRWLGREDEVLFHDIESADHTLLGKKRGFYKLLKCCEQAKSDGLEYVWIDSCCINRTNSTELQESINSMYRWYENAARCYVYLKDTLKPTSGPPSLGEKEDWFKRGWTLQELIAPKTVVFFDRNWRFLGDKYSLKRHISDLTGICQSVLVGLRKPQECSIEERMSWACDRETTKDEDRVYSLLGLFDVNMPMLYGEGESKAFLRLQEEIAKTLSDDSDIVVWDGLYEPHGLLPTSPEAFCGYNGMKESIRQRSQSVYGQEFYPGTPTNAPGPLDVHIYMPPVPSLVGASLEPPNRLEGVIRSPDCGICPSGYGISPPSRGIIGPSKPELNRSFSPTLQSPNRSEVGSKPPDYGKIGPAELGVGRSVSPTRHLPSSNRSEGFTYRQPTGGAPGNKSVWQSPSGSPMGFSPWGYSFESIPHGMIAGQNPQQSIWMSNGDRVDIWM